MKKRSIKKLSLKKAAISHFNIGGNDPFNSQFYCDTQGGGNTCDEALCLTMGNRCHTRNEDRRCLTNREQCDTLRTVCNLTCQCGSSS